MLKQRLDKEGQKFAQCADVVTHGPKVYRAQHLTKEQKFIPKTYELLAGGARMNRHSEQQMAKGEAAIKMLAERERHEAARMDR